MPSSKFEKIITLTGKKKKKAYISLLYLSRDFVEKFNGRTKHGKKNFKNEPMDIFVSKKKLIALVKNLMFYN